MTAYNFDDIRPFDEDEIPAAMQRIAASPSFSVLASYVYPGEPLDDVRRRIAGYRTVRDFQYETMARVNERVLSDSTTGYSCSGLERLSPDKAYLYVSNHRDIVLDSCLLQYSLVKNGFETTEITFGANLMMNQLVIDIGKSNRMFKVERPGGSAKEFYRCSKHLSDYIRHTVKDKKTSVWIAQRNGRTKDGNDSTDQGIIKMFCMSEPADKVKAMDELNVVPVSISYEWEPCDILKVLELYEARFVQYVKKPGEDINSILTGILQQKGRVHIQVCEPIERTELQGMESMTNNEYHKAVAKLIDSRIHQAYRLFPNNYIAYDMRYGTRKYSDCYTAGEKAAFEERLNKILAYDTCDTEQLIDIYLGIYANPVANRFPK